MHAPHSLRRGGPGKICRSAAAESSVRPTLSSYAFSIERPDSPENVLRNGVRNSSTSEQRRSLGSLWVARRTRDTIREQFWNSLNPPRSQ
jgi:hypothetical protein